MGLDYSYFTKCAMVCFAVVAIAKYSGLDSIIAAAITKRSFVLRTEQSHRSIRIN